MKKLLLFILFLIPWYLGLSILPINTAYYYSLKTPFFISTPIILTSWGIIYILNSYISSSIIKEYNFKYSKEYLRSLLFNYIVNLSFLYFFFSLKSLFLSFTCSVIIFISTLIMYYEIQELKPNLKYYLCFYLGINLITITYLLILLFSNL